MPRIAWHNAMAGLMQTPPKINRVTEIPKAQVVIAKMCPLPWYFVLVRTSSQCTPTPNKIIRAVPKNSAISECNITIFPFISFLLFYKFIYSNKSVLIKNNLKYIDFSKCFRGWSL